MSNYLDLVRTVTIQFHDKIIQSCSPLFKNFNLNHFWHYKITHDGGFSFLDTDIEWCEYYGANKLYLKHPYLRSPKLLKTGIYILRNEIPLITNKYKRKNNLNIYKNELQLIRKTPNGIEASGFSATENESHIYLLINEINLLIIII